MEYQELLHRCFRCGWCKLPLNFVDINCPAYMTYRFESFSPGGRLWLIRAWLQGDVEMSDRFREIIFSCATCKNCVEACALPKIKDNLVDIVIAARNEIVQTGKLPGPVRDYLMRVYDTGNPYGKPQADRLRWTDGLDVPLYRDQEFLLFIGDVGAFDESGMEMARNVAKALQLAGVSFGIMGEEEISDGNDVYALGEKDLFKHLAERLMKGFGDRGVKKIIALSPHSYNAFKNYYAAAGGKIDVLHFSHLLALKLSNINGGTLQARVTFHDPCYLGRWNNDYNACRSVLGGIRGIELAEMERNRANSLCCGGGGGNFFTAMLGSGPDSPSRHRVREALDTGADILAVACPICRKMLEDAVKDESAEDSIRVRDIAGIVLEAAGAWH
ncbi:MAG: (Fe-S)-binding protein [Spirochaetes bacterium]|nr:(Fe-S)-binding protein [Spirochaetota bacterium]